MIRHTAQDVLSSTKNRVLVNAASAHPEVIGVISQGLANQLLREYCESQGMKYVEPVLTGTKEDFIDWYGSILMVAPAPEGKEGLWVVMWDDRTNGLGSLPPLDTGGPQF